jgi:hypothetical protein
MQTDVRATDRAITGLKFTRRHLASVTSMQAGSDTKTTYTTVFNLHEINREQRQVQSFYF